MMDIVKVEIVDFKKTFTEAHAIKRSNEELSSRAAVIDRTIQTMDMYIRRVESGVAKPTDLEVTNQKFKILKLKLNTWRSARNDIIRLIEKNNKKLRNGPYSSHLQTIKGVDQVLNDGKLFLIAIKAFKFTLSLLKLQINLLIVSLFSFLVDAMTGHLKHLRVKVSEAATSLYEGREVRFSPGELELPQDFIAFLLTRARDILLQKVEQSDQRKEDLKRELKRLNLITEQKDYLKKKCFRLFELMSSGNFSEVAQLYKVLYSHFYDAEQESVTEGMMTLNSTFQSIVLCGAISQDHESTIAFEQQRKENLIEQIGATEITGSFSTLISEILTSTIKSFGDGYDLSDLANPNDNSHIYSGLPALQSTLAFVREAYKNNP